MRRFVVMLLLAATGSAVGQSKLPNTPVREVTEDYFGTRVSDPYRWLEDLKDKAVESWFKAQADLTDGLLGRISARDRLADEWMKLDLDYIDRWSLGRDAKLILRTFPAVLGGRGAS